MSTCKDMGSIPPSLLMLMSLFIKNDMVTCILLFVFSIVFFSLMLAFWGCESPVEKCWFNGKEQRIFFLFCAVYCGLACCCAGWKHWSLCLLKLFLVHQWPIINEHVLRNGSCGSGWVRKVKRDWKRERANGRER